MTEYSIILTAFGFLHKYHKKKGHNSRNNYRHPGYTLTGGFLPVVTRTNLPWPLWCCTAAGVISILYMLHGENQQINFTSRLRTEKEKKDILSAPHEFRGLFDSTDMILRYGLGKSLGCLICLWDALCQWKSLQGYITKIITVCVLSHKPVWS